MVERMLDLHKLQNDLSPALVLALIHVESSGNPDARRRGSQFCGLLQMGRAAGLDIGLEDEGNATTEHLLGAPMWAVDSFLLYLERYWSRHRGNPEHIAVIWKGGPGTLRLWQDADTDNDSISPEDEEEFSKGWRAAVPVYVDWFREALEVWGRS